VRAALTSGELLFCAHHGREAMPRLKELAARIDDFSADLSDLSLD
jgi:hypothetical protein